MNFSGKTFHIVSYGVRRDIETIDYDELERIAIEQKPRLIVAGASAYPRRLDFERFAAIAGKAGALLMVDMAHIAGLVAAGVHPSPFPEADGLGGDHMHQRATLNAGEDHLVDLLGMFRPAENR